MKKIFFIISLTLLFNSSFNCAYARDVSRVKGDFFGLNRGNRVEERVEVKPVNKKKSWVKVLETFVLVCILAVSLSLYVWYDSCSVEEGSEEDMFEGSTPGGNRFQNNRGRNNRLEQDRLNMLRRSEASNTVDNSEKLLEPSNIDWEGMGNNEVPTCLSCYEDETSVNIIKICKYGHLSCVPCFFEWVSDIDHDCCPSCQERNKSTFTQNALTLAKQVHQCIQINYKGTLVWVNKDFVWLDKTVLKACPREREHYKCGVCRKIQHEAITFLLCTCGKNPLCIACWKKQNNDWLGYECPNCNAYVSESNIKFGEKCLDDPGDHNTHSVLRLQNLLKGGNVDLAEMDIGGRRDSIQRWVEERS